MGVESALGVLVWILVLFVVAYVVHYLIVKFIPADFHVPALFIAGVVFLIIIIMFLLHGGPVGFPLRR